MELSYEQKRTFIMAALDPNNNYAVWIRDVYPDKVIVEDKGKLYEIGYTITDNKAVLGERKEVMVTYEALAELKDIEIFEAGVHRGKTYTDDDLDAMVKNFDEFKDEIQPTAVIGHSEDQKLLQDSGLPAAGWATSLKRVGSKLVASFKDVPKVIADLVGKKAYKRISSEIYNDYKGKGLALRRVALLGGEIPEVKTLQDVAALYGDTGETTWISFDEADQSSKKKGEKEMEQKEIEKFQEQLTKLSEQVTALKTENETLKAEKDKAVTRLSEVAKAEKAGKVKDILAKFTGKEGKSVLAPAAASCIQQFAEQLDSTTVVKFGEGDQAKEATPLDRFGEVLDTLIKRDEKGTLIVQFGEVAPGTKGSEGKGTASEQLATLTKQKMDGNKALSFAEAFSDVQKENPDLAKEYAEDIQNKG